MSNGMSHDHHQAKNKPNAKKETKPVPAVASTGKKESDNETAPAKR